LVPTTANAKHYAKIVEEKSILRRLIKASNEIINMGYEAAERFPMFWTRLKKHI